MTEELVKVFFSYSHRDEEFKDELLKHLSILRRQRVISDWHDRMIMPGRDWHSEIDTYLSSADIILLMVSADFLASDYCWGVEVEKAMQRHEAGQACVIPIMVRWVDWEDTPFARLQALPKNAEPIVSWADRDRAFTDVSKGIRVAANTIRDQRYKRIQQVPIVSDLLVEEPTESVQVVIDDLNRALETQDQENNQGAVRTKTSTMNFYARLCTRYEQLVNQDRKPSSEARKICKQEFGVTAQTVSDALLFLRFPRDGNERAYDLCDRQFFSPYTLVAIFKAAKRTKQNTTDEVIKCLFDRYQLNELQPIKVSPRRGGNYPLSINDVENWMKDTFPPMRQPR